MFTPSELEEIPLEIQRLFSDLEMRIMVDIVERISMIDEISRTTDWEIYTLSRLGVPSENIKKAIQVTLNKSDAEIERIYKEVIEEGYARDKAIYESTGKPFTPYDKNLDLQDYIKGIKEQTQGDLTNLTQSMGVAKAESGRTVFSDLTNYYQRILDNAVMDITTGTFDYNSLIKKVINEMTSSGIRTVTYEKGYTNRIEVAARRALMTGVSQVLQKNTEQMAQDLETEHFEISWHATARPSHQVWQGRVFSKAELVSVCGLGTVTGLLGANCYHAYYPFVLGISERTYTDEQLDEMNAKENKKKPYKSKEYDSYEATQHQRKLETLMRKYKREIQLMEKANMSSEDIQNVSSKYRATMNEYVDFSKKMGLPQQRERIYTPRT